MTHLSSYTKKHIKELRDIAKQVTGFTGVRHIHPRCYVVAKPAAWCAVLVFPPQENEPQVAESRSELIQHKSAKDVQVGDWVATGYVSNFCSGESMILTINGKPVKL